MLHYVYGTMCSTILCSFEKAVQNPGTRVKSLNNLATMYYRLGELY